MNELKTKRDVVKSGFNKSCDAILPPLPNAILPPPKPSIFVEGWFTFEKILPEVLLYGLRGGFLCPFEFCQIAIYQFYVANSRWRNFRLTG